MERHIKCPITHLIFLNPVLLHGDGITYEKQALEKWLKINKKSPITGTSLEQTTFSVNYSMKNIVDEYLKNNPNEKTNQYIEELDENTIKNILRFGTHDEIVELMKDTKYLNMIFSDKCDTLHYVCIYQTHETIKFLIERGANYNNVSNTWYPFRLVCRYQPFETIQYFVEELHCDVNFVDDDGLSLMHFISHRTLQIVQYFVEKGASLKCTCKNGYNLLHGACEYGNIEVIKYLIDNDVDVNAKTNLGDTPLHYACQKQERTIINYLLKHGANPNEKNNGGITPFDILSERNNNYKMFVAYYNSKRCFFNK